MEKMQPVGLARRRYVVVSLSYDECTYCKSLWIKASAKCPKYQGNVNVYWVHIYIKSTFRADASIQSNLQ